ncbi:hypothetical protein HIM_10085 [Hirsutella minnesotensis 3608]|uniref:Uncharacterized protein n=1 Tax=Hirsutella minnesotensis 3608 TaxID=1043627 RepID=A0A0F7ZGA3_9HYPO|nr:hypothetical protein HIM_10085 [Hirsutella minnesotensis 3608]
MPTLLHVLTRRNIAVNSEAVVPGGNTTLATDIRPDNWSPWMDFNYTTLTQIFRRELASSYQGSSEQRPLLNDLLVSNEETLEDFLRRFMSPVVNYALESQVGGPHLGRGSRCGSEDRPDWSVISGSCLDEWGRFVNILPGDTKLDAKWRPNMVQEDPANFAEWQKVMAQIVSYMARHRSRYGFIFTDACLVALRLTREPTGTGIGLARPRRDAAAIAAAIAGHKRHSSDVTMTSGEGSGSSYSDNDPLLWDYYNPEYTAIPWDAHGEGRLTIKLALWCLSMMATNGDSFIDYSYPKLDSWRHGSKEYVHNASGVSKSRLSGSDSHIEPDPDRWRRERDAREAAQDEYYKYTASQAPADDMPQFSQAGSTFGDASGQDYNEGDEESIEDDDDEQEEEALVAGSSRYRSPEPDDRTEIGSSRRHHKRDKRKHVTIQQHKKGVGLYFVNANGYKVDTAKKKWKEVEDGYEYKGNKFIYFTKEFPI